MLNGRGALAIAISFVLAGNFPASVGARNGQNAARIKKSEEDKINKEHQQVLSALVEPHPYDNNMRNWRKHGGKWVFDENKGSWIFKIAHGDRSKEDAQNKILKSINGTFKQERADGQARDVIDRIYGRGTHPPPAPNVLHISDQDQKLMFLAAATLSTQKTGTGKDTMKYFAQAMETEMNKRMQQYASTHSMRGVEAFVNESRAANALMGNIKASDERSLANQENQQTLNKPISSVVPVDAAKPTQLIPMGHPSSLEVGGGSNGNHAKDPAGERSLPPTYLHQSARRSPRRAGAEAFFWTRANG